MKGLAAKALLGIGAVLLPVSAHADDRQVNAIYDRMSAAYAAVDAAALAQVYAADALVFPSRANMPVVRGRESIEKGPGGFLSSIRARGGALRIAFRVIERRVLPGTIVDAGIYRLAVTDPAGKLSVQVGKFMTVAAPQADGNWAFVADTDTPMASDAWDQAKSVRAAKFDQ